MGFACISQHPPKALWDTDPFWGKRWKQRWQAVASWGWDPIGPLWGGFRLVQLSGSSHFRLKTLGLPPPTVLWAPDVLPWLPGGWGGDCVNQ